MTDFQNNENLFQHGQRRLFSVNEANAALEELLPVLEELLELKARMDTAGLELEQIEPTKRFNGYGMKAMILERELTESAARIVEQASLLTSRGIEIKDLDHGIIDFPSMRDGRVVYLCYRLGESKIEYWHEFDSGFAGRRPL
jgi:hypothetical protein